MPKVNLPEDPDAGVSTSLAAAFLGGSSRTVRRLLETGQLEGFRLGERNWKTTPRALREFQQKGGTAKGWRQ